MNHMRKIFSNFSEIYRVINKRKGGFSRKRRTRLYRNPTFPLPRSDRSWQVRELVSFAFMNLEFSLSWVLRGIRMHERFRYGGSNHRPEGIKGSFDGALPRMSALCGVYPRITTVKYSAGRSLGVSEGGER